MRAGGAPIAGARDLPTLRAALSAGLTMEAALGGLRSMGRTTAEVRQLQQAVEGERLGRPSGEALAAGAVAASAARLRGGITLDPFQAAAEAPAGRRIGTLRALMIASGRRAELGPAASEEAAERELQQAIAAQSAAGRGGGGLLGRVTNALGFGGTGDVLRFGLGVAGITSLLSLANKVQDTLAAIADNQFEWERSLRTTAGLYGDMAPDVERIARAQANLPDVVGTQGDFLQANLNAAYLTRRYGVPAGQVAQLTTTGGRLARVLGITDPAEQRRIQAQLLAGVESGGAQLRPFGVELDEETLASRLGFRGPGALAALTPEQVREARGLLATEGVNQFITNARQRQATLLDARAGLQHELDVTASALTEGAENLGRGRVGEPGADVGALIQQLNQPPGAGTLDLVGQLLPAINRPPFGPGTATLQTAYDQAKAAVDANNEALAKLTQELGDAQSAQAEATRRLNELGVTAGGATAQLLSFEGSLEDVTSIARGDLAAQAQAQVAARAVVNPPGFRTPEELAASARQTAEQRAYDLFVSRQAQQQPSAIREFLTRRANLAGPGLEGVREPAQAALAEIERAQPLIEQVQQAQEEQRRAALISEAARSRITKLDLDYQRAQLSVAGQLSKLRVQHLNVEEQLTPLLLRQADLQYRMTVDGRTNLDTERRLLYARQQALAPTEQLEDAQYRGAKARADLGAIGARMVRGTATREDVMGMRGLATEAVNASLDAAEALPGALEAGRAVTDVQRVQTREQIGQATNLLGLEQERRDLEDDIEPLQRRSRELAATVASVEAYLARIREAQEPERTAADQIANVAGAMANAAQDSERFATASLVASGSWVNIATALDAVAKGVPTLTTATDAANRIANGLGAGGLGPGVGEPVKAAANGVAVNVTFGNVTVNSLEDIQRIAQAAGETTYDTVTRQLIYAFNNAQANVNSSMAVMMR